MNVGLKSAPLKVVAGSKAGSSAAEDLRGRESQELIFALSGPVGSGLNFVNATLTKVLEERGYEVVHVKVSALFDAEAARHGVSAEKRPAGEPQEFVRIWTLQDVGNRLRAELGEDLGAQLAIQEISQNRTARHPGEDIAAIKPERVAYVIDQLKNPREAQLLRNVYGNLFFFIGVLSGYPRRKANLCTKMSADYAEKLIHRDRAESDRNGQQLDKTLKLADFFVNNTHHNTVMLEVPLKRLVGLVHGDNGITPTNKEKGMYAAQGAALQSACLSRQVGAAIMDRFGNIISTGCNDVPRAGGGLYESSMAPDDHRCVFWEDGRCFNDKRKDQLRDGIEQALSAEGVVPALAKQYAEAIRQKTGIRDLIEFSRAVHAEMDALVNVARRGGSSVAGGFLFTTTYPCHNCARHIVAAGIRAVYFIEPYEKSLASELHYDSIDHEPEFEPKWDSVDTFSRVAFLHFEGVSPNRFADLFLADSRKDGKGMAVRHPLSSAAKKSPEFLDNYKQLEARVVRRLQQKAPDAPGAG
jgi:deoxycytidylate deaminase